MFEIIKAYRNIRKLEKLLYHIESITEFTNDKEIMRIIQDVRKSHKQIKLILWCHKKIAAEYNAAFSSLWMQLEFITHIESRKR